VNESAGLCITVVMKILLGKDSKKARPEFSDVFHLFEKVTNEGLPANHKEPDIMPICILSP
jgi:hypothetical protein